MLAGLRRLAEHRVKSEHVPGRRFRKVKVEPLLRRLVTRRLGFPAYVLAYRWKNRVYRAVICGQDPSVVRGDAPFSWAKVVLVGLGIAALAAAGLAIAALAG